jgi:hypothetical protein
MHGEKHKQDEDEIDYYISLFVIAVIILINNYHYKIETIYHLLHGSNSFH